MARSFRKHPFCAVTTATSAKRDKARAHRGVRRIHERVVRQMVSEPDLELPHFRECPWNDTWVWDRDGRQKWRGYGEGEEWFVRMMRK